MPRQKPTTGTFFWVPLEDGTVALGQIVEIRPEVLNSITCAFYELRAPEPRDFDLGSLQPISVQFVTPDLFKSGAWQAQEASPGNPAQVPLPYRETEPDGWVGAKVIGSGIVAKFLSAFYGLRDWSEMHDPNYYQYLLLPGVVRAAGV
tara:strand:- start:67 stop:510 length:444 start_codon:yes stop_codon:yes gene_type:complete